MHLLYKFRHFFMPLAAFFCISLFFSCSSDVEMPPPPEPLPPENPNPSSSAYNSSSSQQGATTSSSSLGGVGSSSSSSSSLLGQYESSSSFGVGSSSSSSSSLLEQHNSSSSVGGGGNSSSSSSSSFSGGSSNSTCLESSGFMANCTINKTSYIVGETSTANIAVSCGANCTNIKYEGLKKFDYADIGSKPAGTVNVSAICLYNSQVYEVSENCPAFEVEDTPKPSITCELDKTSYSAGETTIVNSVVTSDGATCGSPNITGTKTFAHTDEGSYPAGTIKASVSCTYKSVSLPVATQNCPAFTVKSDCVDLSSTFCSTKNVVVMNLSGYYHLPEEAICIKIPRSLKLRLDSRTTSSIKANNNPIDGQQIEKFPNDDCGYVYVNVDAFTPSGSYNWPGMLIAE